MADNPQSPDLDLLWGADQIAKAIGATRRRVFHMLEAGALPGARKVGGRWCITRRSLRAIFDDEAAA